MVFAKTWPLWPSFEGSHRGDEEQRRYPARRAVEAFNGSVAVGTRQGAVSYLARYGMGGRSLLRAQSCVQSQHGEVLMDWSSERCESVLLWKDIAGAGRAIEFIRDDPGRSSAVKKALQWSSHTR